MPSCPKCKKKVAKGDLFCNKCGAKLATESIPVGLSYNAKYTYFTDTSTPIDLKLKNISDEEVSDLEVSLSCPKLGLSHWVALPPIAAGEEENYDFEFHFPGDVKGFYTVKFDLTYGKDKTLFHFAGKKKIQICKDFLSALNINIDFSKTKGIGNYIDINLKEAISAGAITTADQLLCEQKAAEDLWRNITLKALKTPYSLSEKPSKNKQKKIMLVDVDNPAHRYYLFGVGKLLFGRPSDEPPDVCTLVYPYEPKDSKALTHMISRKQFSLEIRDAEISVKNLCSARALGTVIDGKKLGLEERKVVTDDVQMNLSMVIGLDMRLHQQKRSDHNVITSADWESIPGVPKPGEDQEELLRIYEKKRVACLAFNRQFLLSGQNRPDEHYLLIPRFATIGNEKNCSICLCDPEVGEHHARIYQYGGRFYFHVLPEGLETTTINGAVPARNEVFPLAVGTQIQLAGSKWEVREVSWDYNLPGEEKSDD